MKKTAKKVSKKSTTVKKTRTKKEEKQKKEERQKKSVAKVNVPQKEEKEKEEKKVLKSDYIQTIGRRKSAICQLRLIKDSKEKKFLINGKDAKKYFPDFENQKNVFAPLQKTNLTATKEIYIEAKVKGGGKKAQSEAVRLALSRALVEMNSDLREILKAQGYLTCDARVKERKKFGFKKARKAPQWSKR